MEGLDGVWNSFAGLDGAWNSFAGLDGAWNSFAGLDGAWNSFAGLDGAWNSFGDFCRMIRLDVCIGFGVSGFGIRLIWFVVDVECYIYKG